MHTVAFLGNVCAKGPHHKGGIAIPSALVITSSRAGISAGSLTELDVILSRHPALPIPFQSSDPLGPTSIIGTRFQ